jgi:hypothetical protein
MVADYALTSIATANDKLQHAYKQIGACDDLSGERRDKIEKAKAAARARNYRARYRKPDAKRGRPGLNLSPEEALRRRRAYKAEHEKARRAAKKAAKECVDKKCVTPSSKKRTSVTELLSTLSVTTRHDINILIPAFIIAEIRSGNPWRHKTTG